MALVSLNLTVVDGKGQESTVTLYTTDTFTIVQLGNAVRAIIPLVRNMITGGITKGTIAIEVDLSGLFTSFPTIAVPDDDSDTEEGALFIFNNSGGDPKRNRIPTFDEALVLAGTREVDQEAVAVENFINAILTGVTVAGPATVTFVDSREEDLQFLSDAYESFQSSRRRRQ